MAAQETSWKPTRKWLAGVISGLGSIGLIFVTDMSWDGTEWGALITLATTSGVSYLIGNPSPVPPEN